MTLTLTLTSSHPAKMCMYILCSSLSAVFAVFAVFATAIPHVSSLVRAPCSTVLKCAPAPNARMPDLVRLGSTFFVRP